MPRTFDIPAGTYAQGVYGPFSVDQITNANTSRLVLTIPSSGLPDDGTPLFSVVMAWDTGGAIEAGPWVGLPRDKFGAVLPFYRVTLDVPVAGAAREKRAVSRGDLTFTVHAPSLTLVSGGSLAAE